MKNRIRRAKKLLQVQNQMLLAERLQLQTLEGTLEQARKHENDAFSLLNDERSQVPPHFLVRRAASSIMRIRNCEALLETQIEKTLDQARKEQLVRKKLESEYKNLSREEAKLALQLTIDAYLSSSVKQD